MSLKKVHDKKRDGRKKVIIRISLVRVRGIVVKVVIERKKIRINYHVVRGFMDRRSMGDVVRLLVVRREVMVRVGIVRVFVER